MLHKNFFSPSLLLDSCWIWLQHSWFPIRCMWHYQEYTLKALNLFYGFIVLYLNGLAFWLMASSSKPFADRHLDVSDRPPSCAGTALGHFALLQHRFHLLLTEIANTGKLMNLVLQEIWDLVWSELAISTLQAQTRRHVSWLLQLRLNHSYFLKLSLSGSFWKNPSVITPKLLLFSEVKSELLKKNYASFTIFLNFTKTSYILVTSNWLMAFLCEPVEPVSSQNTSSQNPSVSSIPRLVDFFVILSSTDVLKSLRMFSQPAWKSNHKTGSISMSSNHTFGFPSVL